jgi:D-alanyl-D-alanine carboxypeptidase
MAFSARRIAFCLLIAITITSPLAAQSSNALAERIQTVMSRPEFAHSNFGIEFFDMQTGQVLYALNADKVFVPASTTKLLTEGTVLAKLGSDFRFHTVRVPFQPNRPARQARRAMSCWLQVAIQIFRTAFSRTAHWPSWTTTTRTRGRRCRAIR